MHVQTDKISLAAQFVNSTQRHIFLTGKAGTGKTTFLRSLARETHKNFAICAPTGIAALNAKGVTIHSLFQLPFGSFLPVDTYGEDLSGSAHFYTPNSLSKKHFLSATKKKVLRSIDLLIIDEVSMLRADILDAMDHRLRKTRGRPHETFGGVQVLMIGDLHQLPPIVKSNEAPTLLKHYPSMHFFEAHALRGGNTVFLELDKIFRQSDNRFVDVLNNLRNNTLSQKDLDILNAQFRTEDEIKQEGEVIHLTTHNRKADAKNEKELQELKGKEYVFDSEVEGNFPESMYPLPEQLRLKVGAQIMFIKNDRQLDKRYFNGKLAKVISIDDEEITVELAGPSTSLRDLDSLKDREPVTLTLEQEVWENKKYILNEGSQELEEEVVGTFTQFPVKLAWAVTVHKSQGLTFDKAVIDVGEAFAPGQVYVAMSRLTSLEGLMLSAKINSSVVSTDQEVVRYTSAREQDEPLEKKLKEGQSIYLRHLLDQTFDFTQLRYQLQAFRQGKAGEMVFEDLEMRDAMDELSKKMDSEHNNTQKFRENLAYYLQHDEREKLSERLEKGSGYYQKFLGDCLKMLLVHKSHVEQFSRTKIYLEELDGIDQSLVQKMADVEKVIALAASILDGKELKKDSLKKNSVGQLRATMLAEVRQEAEENPKVTKGKTGRKRKKKTTGLKPEKGDTYQLTFDLLSEGLSIADVAKMRGLVASTIEGHVAKGIEAGRLKLTDHMEAKDIKIISQKLKEHNGERKAAFDALNGKYSYGKIKMVLVGKG